MSSSLQAKGGLHRREDVQQVPEGSARQEGEGRALQAKELAGAKALRHRRAGCVLCLANGLGGNYISGASGRRWCWKCRLVQSKAALKAMTRSADTAHGYGESTGTCLSGSVCTWRVSGPASSQALPTGLRPCASQARIMSTLRLSAREETPTAGGCSLRHVWTPSLPGRAA